MDRACAAALTALLVCSPAVAAPNAAPKKKAGGAVAAPAKPAADRPDAPAEGTSQHNEGEYGGVVPGQPQKADPGHGKPKRPPPKGTLAWLGFEAKAGGTEVFLQSVAPFEVNQHVDNGVLVVELGGLTKLGQNTWRPIDTRFFGGPISQILAKRVSATKGKNAHAARVEVRIAFKAAKDAKEGTLRTASEADGYYYAYLGFAGGDTVAQPTLQEPEK